MTGFSRSQGVPLHRGPHQPQEKLYRLTTVVCTGLL